MHLVYCLLPNSPFFLIWWTTHTPLISSKLAILLPGILQCSMGPSLSLQSWPPDFSLHSYLPPVLNPELASEQFIQTSLDFLVPLLLQLGPTFCNRLYLNLVGSAWKKEITQRTVVIIVTKRNFWVLSFSIFLIQGSNLSSLSLTLVSNW